MRSDWLVWDSSVIFFGLYYNNATVKHKQTSSVVRINDKLFVTCLTWHLIMGFFGEGGWGGYVYSRHYWTSNLYHFKLPVYDTSKNFFWILMRKESDFHWDYYFSLFSIFHLDDICRVINLMHAKHVVDIIIWKSQNRVWHFVPSSDLKRVWLNTLIITQKCQFWEIIFMISFLTHDTKLKEAL